MKTRVLYRHPKLGGGWSEFYGRAYLPNEVDPNDSGAVRHHRVARFIPAHVESYYRLGDDLKGPKRTASKPDSIEIGSYRYRASWAKPLDTAVVLSDEDVATLDEYDRLIESLRIKRKNFMRTAAERSRRLRIDDLTTEDGQPISERKNSQ